MILLLLHIAIVLFCAAHILLRRHREPVSRLAWLVVVLALPYIGALAYWLLGSTNIGHRRAERLAEALRSLPWPDSAPGWPPAPDLPDAHRPLFTVGETISHYTVCAGNRARLMADSDAAIDAMIADIDAARAHVHVMFYIWLEDRNGTRFAEALIRAAQRGVACRAMADGLGSRALLRGGLWTRMAAAGVRQGVALRIGNPFLRILDGRIDLRNHRKVLVVDNAITYCGSQNCADPAFLPKESFGPWVDAMMRFEGPVARQNQHLFAADWMGATGEDLGELLRAPMPPAQPGFAAQVIATGPTARYSAMPEMFETLIFAARRRLFLTTPYYVPDPAIQAALCAAANRGVEVTMIFPARNDDFAVGAASRSYYEDLLQAGVRIHEFRPGLLHTKSLTMDEDITLIGSANMDRRSFDLNYENNILFQDTDATAAIRARQQHYLTQSREITLAEVAAWSIPRRIWNNALAILGPVL